jgi:uncharacterized protein (TIGR00290 family)
MPNQKTILSWSTGKDAAYALHQLVLQNKKPDLLLCTVNKDFNRVSMHGLRIELLIKQAEMLQIPLHTIALSKDVNIDEYNSIMYKELLALRKKGYQNIVFGDIFLEDLRIFREQQMQKVNLTTSFPLWKQNTKELALQIIDSGIKAIVVAVNAKLLDKTFVGREFDRQFLNDLPSNVDYCGENGEFHSFVYDSPDFISPISFTVGEKIHKEYKPCTKSDQKAYKKDAKNTHWDTAFWYVDLY